MANANTAAPAAGASLSPPQGKSGFVGWLHRNRSYLIAFILPVVLIYIAYAIFGLYPFGEHSVLCLDLNGQYVYYFEALRDAFHGDGAILYNWERNLSGGYQGVIGYYLASPFTMIVVLLPRTMILGALLIMILCKLGCASVAFCYYAQKSKHVKPSFAVMLGTMFGMCAYGIIQTIDPMWLDGLIALPFICLGIEYLVDDGRKLNFIIPLAYICIANFYIGFMCCIFTAIYFVYYVCFGSDKLKLNKTVEVVTVIGRMALASAVAIACAAFMILPVYNALALGKFDFTKPDWSFKAQFTPLEFIAQFCVNQYNSVNVEGKPEIYCGVLAFICLPLFFLNRRIPLRKKIGYAFLVGIMFTCMYARPLDMLWHGGQMPNWLPFRYSFIFSFILLSMTAMTLRYVTSIKKEMVALCFAVIFVLLMIIDSKKYLNMKGAVYLDTFQSIWMTVIFLAIYAGIIIIMSKKNLSKGMQTFLTVALLCAVSGELTYNAVTEFKDIHTEVAYSTRKSYRQYVESGREVVQRLYSEDPTFYRADKTFTRTVNDNAGFGLRGITHSSSVMNTQILKFIEAMGYSCRSYYSRYDGNTPLADSLLGIKYVIDKGDPNTNLLKKGENSDLESAYTLKFSTTMKSQAEADMDVNVYENPNALSLGYMVSSDITRIQFFGNDNPFNSQNLLLSTITGNTTFTEGGGFQDWHKYYHDLTITRELRLNDVYEDVYGTQRNFREIKPQDAAHAADPTVDIFIETETDEPLYLFFKSENESKVNLWLTDQWNEDPHAMKNTDGTPATGLGSYFENDNYHILYVGQWPAGQKLQLRMTLLTDAAETKEKYTIIKNFFFCHFDEELFRKDINTLKNQQWNLTKFGGRTLEGTITAASNQVMMTSVPAEPGWKIWVDGKRYYHNATLDGKEIKEDYLELFQGMIGVELEPGEHTVKMRYTPPGLLSGLFMLACGIFCCVVFYFYDHKHNKTVQLILANRKKGIYELPYEDDPEPEEVVRLKKSAAGAAGAKNAEIPFESIADEIRKLKELKDEGVLSEEEFESAKKKLLNK